MTKRTKGEFVGTVKCPICGQTIEMNKTAQTLSGSCRTPNCKAKIIAKPRILQHWQLKGAPAPAPDVKGKESLGMSGPETVAESPPTPPDNHVPILPEPADPQAAPIKTLPAVEPKAAEVMPKEVIVAPSPPPAPVVPVPDKKPPLFKRKKKEEPDNAPATPPPGKSSSLFKIKKKEESDNDRKDG